MKSLCVAFLCTCICMPVLAGDNDKLANEQLGEANRLITGHQVGSSYAHFMVGTFSIGTGLNFSSGDKSASVMVKELTVEGPYKNGDLWCVKLGGAFENSSRKRVIDIGGTKFAAITIQFRDQAVAKRVADAFRGAFKHAR